MVLAVATISMNVGVAESAERTRSASVKSNGSLRNGAIQARRSDAAVQVPDGAITDNVQDEDWAGLIDSYNRVGVSTIVGPVEVVDEFSVTDGKSTGLPQMAALRPEEGRLVAVTAVNLAGGLLLEPGEEIYLGDMIEDGLIANVGETAFTVRLANESEAVLAPTISLGIVPTKGATCCMMCTSCFLEEGMLSCLGCEACNAAGLPRGRVPSRPLTIGNPCLEH